MVSVVNGRKRFQRAPRECQVNFLVAIYQFRLDYKRGVSSNKDLLCSLRKKTRRFVGVHSDDPWGRVYQICKEKWHCRHQGERRTYADMRDSIYALLGELFPRSEPSVSPDDHSEEFEEKPHLKFSEV